MHARSTGVDNSGGFWERWLFLRVGSMYTNIDGVRIVIASDYFSFSELRGDLLVNLLHAVT